MRDIMCVVSNKTWNQRRIKIIKLLFNITKLISDIRKCLKNGKSLCAILGFLYRNWFSIDLLRRVQLQTLSIIIYVSSIEHRNGGSAGLLSFRPRVLLLLRKNNNSGDASGANKSRAILHNCRRIYCRCNQEMSQLFGSGRANFTL